VNVSYPFHPLQFLLDQKASIALAAVLSRMGSALQLVSYDVGPQGFMVEVSAASEPTSDWIYEWFRQASLLMKEDWPRPVEMTAENVKLFWKQKGQYLRARHYAPGFSLVSVLTWPGMLEFFEGELTLLQPLKFDSLVLIQVKSLVKQVKGHQEKFWLIEGRVAPTSEARKLLQKLKPSFETRLEAQAFSLSGAQMRELLQLELLWIKAIEKEAPLKVFLSEEKLLNTDQGFVWKKERASSKSYVPFWQEPLFETLVFEQVASKEEVQKSLSFLLRMISEIVKILELEMKGSLKVRFHSEKINSWVELFEASSCPLSLIEEEARGAKEELFWQISAQEEKVTWWPMAEMKLTCLIASKWQLQARPVTSFYRWMKASEKKTSSLSII
jgi:hypothetical protein